MRHFYLRQRIRSHLPSEGFHGGDDGLEFVVDFAGAADDVADALPEGDKLADELVFDFGDDVHVHEGVFVVVDDVVD